MRLKELRERIGLTQRDLGKIVGISDTTVSSYETGDSSPSIKVLIKLADYFNVSVDFLIGHDNEMLDMKALDENQKFVVKNTVYKLDDSQVAKVCGYIENMLQ